MATIESLKRQVDATEQLKSVVRTMKALAAVNIRQYEQADTALADYRRTIDLGLRAVLRHAHPQHARKRRLGGRIALIVIGSDQGMCGQFNERIVRHTLAHLPGGEGDRQDPLVQTIGVRVAAALDMHKLSVTAAAELPGSVAGLAALVKDVTARLDRWQRAEQVREVWVFANRYERPTFAPNHDRLLPLDAAWVAAQQDEPWPTKRIPLIAAPPAETLSRLVREHVFVELQAALAGSLAAENATRLRAMQSAEKNVDERLDQLSSEYFQQRQADITGELLDVVSGSMALGA